MVVFYVTNMISHVWSAAIGNLFDTIFRKVMITKESYETILNLLKVFLDQFRFWGISAGSRNTQSHVRNFLARGDPVPRVLGLHILATRKIILTRGNQSLKIIVSESSTVPWISDD